MNIYVGNLSYDSNENTIRNAFETYGQVDSARVITDQDSGRSKGFGFVEMTDDNEAREAIAALNDTNLDGRNVRVNEAKPKTNSGGNRNFRNRY